MDRIESKKQRYIYRKMRVRKKVKGTAEKPRLTIKGTLKHIYTQIIDDTKGVTLASASTLSSELKGKYKNGANKQSAVLVGQLITEKAKQKNISQVVFDRQGQRYHGRIKEFAESARKSGLKF